MLDCKTQRASRHTNATTQHATRSLAFAVALTTLVAACGDAKDDASHDIGGAPSRAGSTGVDSAAHGGVAGRENAFAGNGNSGAFAGNGNTLAHAGGIGGSTSIVATSGAAGSSNVGAGGRAVGGAQTRAGQAGAGAGGSVGGAGGISSTSGGAGYGAAGYGAAGSANGGAGYGAAGSANGGAITNAGAAGLGAATLLSQTGLYEADMKTLRASVVEYAPQFELWSDGASKRRWIYLPPGSVIDTSDPDYWVFPVGTKVWKEFSKNGKRIETRIIERISTRSYRMIAYLWREDLTDAVAVPDGQVNALGSGHDVPNATACETCHNNQPGRIVGVGALQLDRDDVGLTLAKLEASGRLSAPIPSPRQWPGDATARAALGVLHSNCGICHNPRSLLPFKTLDLWQRVGLLASLAETPMVSSAVGVPTETNPDGATPSTIVVPGNPTASALVYRMGSRTDRVSMPPLASKVVDQAGLKAVSDFIAALK